MCSWTLPLQSLPMADSLLRREITSEKHTFLARKKSESQRSDARACTVLLYTASFAIEKLFVKDKVFESCDEQQVAEAF